MSSTDIVSHESGKDIDKKMETSETIPVDMNGEFFDNKEGEFDNEAEAIKVTTDHAGEPARWGKGIVRDFKRTVGTNWLKEMTNFNQKTVAVTVSLFELTGHDWFRHWLSLLTVFSSSSSTSLRLRQLSPSEPCMEGVPRTTWEQLS